MRILIRVMLLLATVLFVGSVAFAGNVSPNCDTDVRRGPSVECGVGAGILANHTIRTYDAKICGDPKVNGNHCKNQYDCVVKATTEYSRDGDHARCTKVTSFDTATIKGCCCVVFDP